jgi:hypothetical protein
MKVALTYTGEDLCSETVVLYGHTTVSSPEHVDVDGVRFVPEKVAEKSHTFEPGDHVRIVGVAPDDGHEGHISGLYGRVVFDGDSGMPGVEFMAFDARLHSLNGRVKEGHGWYVPTWNLEVVE